MHDARMAQAAVPWRTALKTPPKAPANVDNSQVFLKSSRRSAQALAE
jgi:hypothetical protein